MDSDSDDASLEDEEAVGGRSRDKCVMLDVDDTQLPLKWENVSEPVALGTRVTLRIYFRDATIFAVGSGEE